MVNSGIKALLISLFILTGLLTAQEQTRKNLLILPFDANGIDPVYVQTAQSILRVEILKYEKIDLISPAKTLESLDGNDCFTTECAVEIGKRAGADQVAGCRLAALGEKIIVQYFLMVISSGKPLLMDQISAVSLEDLEPVMKRVASNIIEMKASESNVQVGNIVKEETTEPLRRSSRKNIGLSFGYLFPQNGYENDDKSFTINLHLDYEMEQMAVGMLLGVRDGFAMNIYGDYLFSRTDICPYVGGAFGFHWVTHPSYGYTVTPQGSVSVDNSNKASDGFELTLNTGLRILHTYNFQILLNLEYIMTFNDYDDRALVFTIGIL